MPCHKVIVLLGSRVTIYEWMDYTFLFQRIVTLIRTNRYELTQNLLSNSLNECNKHFFFCISHLSVVFLMVCTTCDAASIFFFGLSVPSLSLLYIWTLYVCKHLSSKCSWLFFEINRTIGQRNLDFFYLIQAAQKVVIKLSKD